MSHKRHARHLNGRVTGTLMDRMPAKRPLTSRKGAQPKQRIDVIHVDLSLATTQSAHTVCPFQSSESATMTIRNSCAFPTFELYPWEVLRGTASRRLFQRLHGWEGGRKNCAKGKMLLTVPMASFSNVKRRGEELPEGCSRDPETSSDRLGLGPKEMPASRTYHFLATSRTPRGSLGTCVRRRTHCYVLSAGGWRCKYTGSDFLLLNRPCPRTALSPPSSGRGTWRLLASANAKGRDGPLAISISSRCWDHVKTASQRLV